MRCPNTRIIETPAGQRWQYQCRGQVVHSFLGAPMCSGCLKRVVAESQAERKRRAK